MAALGDPVTYADVVLADTPAAYWRLGESSGSTAEDETGAHDGTIGAGVTLGATGALGGSGDTNTAATFNGGSTGVVSTTGWTALPSTLTVEGWVKLSTSVPSLHQCLIGLAANGTTRLGVLARRNATGNRLAVWDNVRGWRESTTTLTLNTWHHVVVVFEGSDVDFYVDGAFVNTVTTGPIGTTYTNVSVGASQNTGSDPLRGDIDEAAVYLRALTSTEIAEHYTAGTTEAAPTGSGGSTATVSVSASGAGIGPPGPLTDLAWPAYISHRGGDGIYPQNTMTAYEQATNAPPMILETDIHVLQSDGVSTVEQRMALAHDPQVTDTPLYESDGTTPASGSLFSTTRATFLTYRVPYPGGSPAPVPTSMWEELADLAVENGQAICVEAKHGGAVDAIIDSTLARGMREYVLAYSFTYSQSVEFATAGLHAMWLTTTFATNSAATVKAAGIDHVGWQAGTANFAAYVSAAHAAGLKVWVYTVTSRSQADDYLAQGADGIITSRPDLVHPDGTAASGGSTATVTAGVQGAGFRTAQGGSTATTTTTVTGAGVRAAQSGATTTVTTTPGGTGIKAAQGGATPATTTTTTGGGHKGASAGATPSITVIATGAGIKPVAGQSGSTAHVTTTAAGAGWAARSGGSTTGVNVNATGAGVAYHPSTGAGGTLTTVTVTTTGNGSTARTGGSTAGVLVAATGGGRNPDGYRDIEITLGAPSVNPLTFTAPTAHPWRLSTPET